VRLGNQRRICRPPQQASGYPHQTLPTVTLAETRDFTKSFFLLVCPPRARIPKHLGTSALLLRQPPFLGPPAAALLRCARIATPLARSAATHSAWKPHGFRAAPGSTNPGRPNRSTFPTRANLHSPKGTAVIFLTDSSSSAVHRLLPKTSEKTSPARRRAGRRRLRALHRTDRSKGNELGAGARPAPQLCKRTAALTGRLLAGRAAIPRHRQLLPPRSQARQRRAAAPSSRNRRFPKGRASSSAAAKSRDEQQDPSSGSRALASLH